jgi:two-component system phosphate regulon sensor histidine kinase PhoR
LASNEVMRAIAATGIAGIGVAVAAWAGAPMAASLLALLAGALAYALWPASRREAPAPPPPEEAEPAALPGIADLLRAVDEPLLLVRERRVTAANGPARQLLGDHIEGADVRLAIRHPAAAERLAGPIGDEAQEPERVELVGVGEADRHWAMVVTALPDGSRLVRLSDQSEARAAEQMRVDFVANASHELRTPLATLLGFIETLQDQEAGGDKATRNRFLKIMMDEAIRMRALVDDLMSLSRIEAERFTLPREPVDLIPLIEEVRAGLAQLMEARDCRLVIENEAGASIVQGDRPQLAQMLANLLSNAVKYGRPESEVRIRLEPAGEMLRVTVIDRGEGIAPEHLPRLTERFYRVDASRSRQVGGTGLGLAIVKHIVLRHRGRLAIESVPGEGTTVHVDLPPSQEPVSSKSHAAVTQAVPDRS